MASVFGAFTQFTKHFLLVKSKWYSRYINYRLGTHLRYANRVINDRTSSRFSNTCVVFHVAVINISRALNAQVFNWKWKCMKGALNSNQLYTPRVFHNPGQHTPGPRITSGLWPRVFHLAFRNLFACFLHHNIWSNDVRALIATTLLSRQACFVIAYCSRDFNY